MAQQRAKADASFYTAQKLAEANALLFTKEYIEVLKYQSIANNTKVYFGQGMNGMFIDLVEKLTQSQPSK